MYISFIVIPYRNDFLSGRSHFQLRMLIYMNKTHCIDDNVHSVSFVINIYKQRFFQPVDFSEKNKQQND